MKCGVFFLILVVAGAADQTPKGFFREYQQVAQALQGEDCHGSIRRRCIAGAKDAARTHGGTACAA
jgi:hypothetical protein